MASTRIALVDDHPLFRDALAEVLLSGDGRENLQILEAGSIDELLERLDAGLELDLLMLDLEVPGLQGLLGLLSVRVSYPMIPIIVVSARTEPSVVGRSLMLGAASFIPKSSTPQEIRKCVRAVMEGDRSLPDGFDPDYVGGEEQRRVISGLCSLSPRELQVVMALSRGLLNRQIAQELDIAEATVKAHVSRALEKLGAHSRLQAMLVLRQLDGNIEAAQPSGEGIELAG